MKLRNITAKLLPALLAAVLFLMSSCSDNPVSVRRISAPGEFDAVVSSLGVHSMSDSLESAAKGSFIELFIDHETTGICVRDNENNLQWASMPVTENKYAAVMLVTLITEKGVYHLNTQDNSVAFGSFETEKKENGASVRYVLATSRQAAEKKVEDLSEGEPRAELTVDYTLNAQGLTASVDMSAAVCPKGTVISSVTLLPYLGAETAASAGDFILVPDGSGAVMHTDMDSTSTEELSFAVYGTDPSFGTESGAAARLPVFGVSSGGRSYAAVLTSGAATARILAGRAVRGMPSYCHACFDVTPCTAAQGGSHYYLGAAYKGTIAVTYKFLAPGSGYSEMASAAREELIRMGYLRSSTLTNKGLTLCLNTVGYGDGKVLATTEQARTLLETLKGRGVDSIDMFFYGLLSGGLRQRAAPDVSVLRRAGGEMGLHSLYEYMQSQSFRLFVCVNALSDSGEYPDASACRDLSGNKVKLSLSNPLADNNRSGNRLAARIGAETAAEGLNNASAALYSSDTVLTLSAGRADTVSEVMSRLVSRGFTSYCDGMCFGDISSVVAAGNDIDRQTAADSLSAALRSASASGSLAVAGGSAYSLYGADTVVDIPTGTFYTESTAYEPVPFTQLVLHGRVAYTGSVIDAASPLYRYEMLRTLEYGAMPAVTWVFDESSIYYYGYYIQAERMAELTDFYAECRETLGDLTGEEMIRHAAVLYDVDGKLLTGVYKTSYSDGTDIYVNYNNRAVTTAGNIVIGPNTCIRTNR